MRCDATARRDRVAQSRCGHPRPTLQMCAGGGGSGGAKTTSTADRNTDGRKQCVGTLKARLVLTRSLPRPLATLPRDRRLQAPRPQTTQWRRQCRCVRASCAARVMTQRAGHHCRHCTDAARSALALARHPCRPRARSSARPRVRPRAAAVAECARSAPATSTLRVTSPRHPPREPKVRYLAAETH